MKKLLLLPTLLCCLGLSAQQVTGDTTLPTAEKVISKTLSIQGSTELLLEFPFAKDIRLSNTHGNEIRLNISASINDGQHNEAYELSIRRDGDRILVGTDRERLEKHFKSYSDRKTNCQSTDIRVEVAIPPGMQVTVESISANVTGEVRDKPYAIKTISGDIDLTVPTGIGAELTASTVSGAMYANVHLDYLDAQQGLRQLVGEKIHANINKGGEPHRLETISGDVLLRAGQ